MKNFLEKVKDVLYNISDYIIIFSIIVGIGLIITWRLDILFPKNLTDIESNTSVEKENKESKMIEKPELENKDNEGAEVKDEKPKDTETKNVVDEKKDVKPKDTEAKDAVDEKKDVKPKDAEVVKKEEPKLIKVTIPADSNPRNIADILLANKLIKDIKEFEASWEKLDLKKELRPGEYEIKECTSLEEIIKILAHKNKA